MLDPTKRCIKPEIEHQKINENYDDYILICQFFHQQENRLIDEFLTKNNMQKKEWLPFAKEASLMLSKCKSCDDIDGEQVCKNNCSSHRWTLFSYNHKESIEKELFETVFKTLAKYEMSLYKNNSIKLAKIYLRWKRKGYKEINILNPLYEHE